MLYELSWIFQDIDMQSAKRLHSVKSKKRELRGAQRESRKKVEKLKEVAELHQHQSVHTSSKF